MIINKIRLQEEFPMTGVSDSWPLPVCDLNLNSSSGANGYILQQVEGLEPPELTEVVEGFDPAGIPAIIDVPEKRELVFKIGLSPGVGQTHGELRDDLYKLISRTVLVKFMYQSTVLAQTIGYIRRCEAVHFSNKPEIQMTIQCKDGPLEGPLAVGIPISTLNTANPVFNYGDGSAPTGLDLKFTVTAPVSGFSITNHGRVRSLSTEPNSNRFELEYPLLVGDQVTLATQPRKRRLTVLRAGVTTDVAGYIKAGAVWPLLYPGVNTFVWTLNSSWLTWITATYTPRFWGV